MISTSKLASSRRVEHAIPKGCALLSAIPSSCSRSRGAAGRRGLAVAFAGYSFMRFSLPRSQAAMGRTDGRTDHHIPARGVCLLWFVQKKVSVKVPQKRPKRHDAKPPHTMLAAYVGGLSACFSSVGAGTSSAVLLTHRLPPPSASPAKEQGAHSSDDRHAAHRARTSHALRVCSAGRRKSTASSGIAPTPAARAHSSRSSWCRTRAGATADAERNRRSCAMRSQVQSAGPASAGRSGAASRWQRATTMA
jgi:hypothetical protein